MQNKEVRDALQGILSLCEEGNPFHFSDTELVALMQAYDIFDLLSQQDVVNALWDNTRKDR